MTVTIHDIAKATGKSYPTVSRALNNHPKISEKTKLLIKETAARLGYRPSFAGIALQRGKTMTFNVVVPTLQNPFYAKLVSEVQRRCRQNGYDVNINEYDYNPTMEYRYFDRVLNRTCDGVIAMPSSFHHTAELFNRMWEFDIPCVSIGVPAGAEKVKIDMVDIDMKSPSRVEYLASLGHKNILYAIGGHAEFQTDICCRSFQREMEHVGLPFDPAKNLCVIHGYVSDLAGCGYNCGKQIFQQFPDVTAIVAVNDTFACGIIRAAMEEKVRIPLDVSIIGQDNIWPGLYTPVTLTTYDLNLEDAMNQCFKLLFQSRNRAPIAVKVKAQLIIRESTGPAKPQKTSAIPKKQV